MWGTNKSWVLTVLLVMLAPAVFANWDADDTCLVKTPCTIAQLVTNSSNQIQTQSTCNVTIRNETTLLLNQTGMSSSGTAWHNYSFIPNHTGIYTAQVLCNIQNTTTNYGTTFVAQRGVSRFMGWEIAIPLFMLGAAFLLLNILLKDNSKRKKSYAWIMHDHALMAGILLFLILGLVFLKHIAEYENSIGNPVLSRIDALLEVVFVSTMYAFYFVMAIIVIVGIIRSVLLFKELQREGKKAQKEDPDAEFELLE